MIRINRVFLLARASQRGYSHEEVLPCIVISHDDGTVTVDENHQAYPHPRAGLGDQAAKALSVVGITEERVSKLIGRPCGCKKRKQWLNDIGRRLFGIGGTPSE